MENARFFIVEEKPHSTFPKEAGSSFATSQITYYEWVGDDSELRKINLNDNPCIREITHKEFISYNSKNRSMIRIEPFGDYEINFVNGLLEIEFTENTMLTLFGPDEETGHGISFRAIKDMLPK